MSKPVISLRDISKRFGSFEAVQPTNLDIEVNEFFALLGPSGCGKTTLLRMIAGFETPSTGTIIIDGEEMNAIAPNKRPVNMVFQSYAVFPHMNVADNVAYGLKVMGVAATECSKRSAAAMERVGLASMANRMPDQLSGGQRQRVALARALVKEPKVLLLDEPLSALDAKLREQMQMELSKLQEDIGVTFIIVTHDQDEALSMADRIAVMQSGGIEQIATPARLYEEPANRFVADFIGKINLVEAHVTGAKGGQVSLSTSAFGKLTIPYEGHASGKIWLAIRPEKLRIKAATGRRNAGIMGTISQWAYYGDISHMQVTTTAGETLGVVLQNTSRDSVHAMDIGDKVALDFDGQDFLVLDE